MSKYLSRYRKAAKLQRTWNSLMIKTIRESSTSDEAAKLNSERWDIQQTQRKFLDKTLGQQALAEIYWEGKEL